MTIISYDLSDKAWDSYEELLKQLVNKHELRNICDVGGGANPLFSIEYIKRTGIHYTVFDISDEELQKIPSDYNKRLVDISSPNIGAGGQFDLIFSKMVCEHVRDGKQLHKNVFSLLKKGGIAVHFFPTLYALPFVANKLIPENLTSQLLEVFAPRDNFQNKKFPAYYDWCKGPTKNMLNMFREIGYEILEFRAFFGHDYYDKIPLLNSLEERYSKYLVSHPNPYLTSYTQIILQKPL
jgi:SAM-dependent methyltransferase